MNDSPLRMFCESRHRKLIVAIVTTLVGLAVIVPLTDDYFDKRESRMTLKEDLDHARETERTLPEFEKRVDGAVAKLAKLESRTVSEQSLSDYRNKLIEMIRKSGCQMRSLEAGKPTTRPWLKNDDPFHKHAAPAKKRKKTQFKLERRTLTMLVDGGMPEIHNLLTALEKDELSAFPYQVKLHSTAGRESTTLDMKIWLFALTR